MGIDICVLLIGGWLLLLSKRKFRSFAEREGTNNTIYCESYFVVHKKLKMFNFLWTTNLPTYIVIYER